MIHLDFTIKNENHIKTINLKTLFFNIIEQVSEQSGIEFNKEMLTCKVIDKTNNKTSAQLKLHYKGPLQRKNSYASIKLDLTTDEIVVLPSVKREISHVYSDKDLMNKFANCYSFEEVIAEKIRALGERFRPRDVYDVVHCYRSRNLISNVQLIKDVLKKKCQYKKVTVPSLKLVHNHSKKEDLIGSWGNMLGHQLPTLPPIAPFLEELIQFFKWFDGSNSEILKLQKVSDEETPKLLELNTFCLDNFIQSIRFAAANRLCVLLTYQDKTRTVEPLSFRIAHPTGKRLFYAFERDSAQLKSYELTEIQNVKLTNLTYAEQWAIEID